MLLNWFHQVLLLLLVLASCSQCDAWKPWFMSQSSTLVDTPTPLSAALPVVSQDEPAPVVLETHNPLLNYYQEVPAKTFFTLFWSSVVSLLLISRTSSLWWKLVVSPTSALVSYGLASCTYWGICHLLFFLKVRFSNNFC